MILSMNGKWNISSVRHVPSARCKTLQIFFILQLSSQRKGLADFSHRNRTCHIPLRKFRRNNLIVIVCFEKIFACLRIHKGDVACEIHSVVICDHNAFGYHDVFNQVETHGNSFFLLLEFVREPFGKQYGQNLAGGV